MNIGKNFINMDKKSIKIKEDFSAALQNHQKNNLEISRMEFAP